jgi:hypothetical protein
VAVLSVVGLTALLGWWEIQLFLDNLTTRLTVFLGWWEIQLFLGSLGYWQSLQKPRATLLMAVS